MLFFYLLAKTDDIIATVQQDKIDSDKGFEVLNLTFFWFSLKLPFM